MRLVSVLCACVVLTSCASESETKRGINTTASESNSSHSVVDNLVNSADTLPAGAVEATPAEPNEVVESTDTDTNTNTDAAAEGVGDSEDALPEQGGSIAQAEEVIVVDYLSGETLPDEAGDSVKPAVKMYGDLRAEYSESYESIFFSAEFSKVRLYHPLADYVEASNKIRRSDQCYIAHPRAWETKLTGVDLTLGIFPTRPISAGESVVINSSAGTIANMTVSPYTNSYGVAHSFPPGSAPEVFTAFVTGDEFPGITDGIEFPAQPQFLIETPTKDSGWEITDPIRWASGEASSIEFYFNVQVEGVDDEIQIDCYAKNDGEFLLPANIISVFGERGVTPAVVGMTAVAVNEAVLTFPDDIIIWSTSRQWSFFNWR